MEKVKTHLKEKYHLTGYQAAQVIFLFKSFLSEFSKTLIMGVLFHRHLPEYVFALFVMIFLRTTTGGIHFYTYWGCLLMSVTYVGLSILVLPMIDIPLLFQLPLLLAALITCYAIGPIVSKYRPETPPEQIQKSRLTVAIFIFIYTLILFIFPEVPILEIGFWVIITHSLQLVVAKILKKGVKKDG